MRQMAEELPARFPDLHNPDGSNKAADILNRRIFHGTFRIRLNWVPSRTHMLIEGRLMAPNITATIATPRMRLPSGVKVLIALTDMVNALGFTHWNSAA